MADQKPISADSHVNEPADLWVERIDTKFRDRAPRVADNLEGRPPGSCLVLEGIPPGHVSQGLGAGKRPEELPAFFRSSTYKDARRGGWDPAERVKDMDVVMWSSDYPHTVSTWPHSQEVIARDFARVPGKPKSGKSSATT